MPLSPDDVISFICEHLAEVTVFVGSEDLGSPEVAWGDSFIYSGQHDDMPKRLPFATIITKDYPGFDEASDLDRAHTFRLNLQLNRADFEQLFPNWSPEGYDFSQVDVLMPHPVYSPQFWVCIVNPSLNRLDEMAPLLRKAHKRGLRTS